MGRSETAFSVVIIWFTAVFIFSACKLIRSKIGRVLLFHAHSPERGNSFSKPGKNRSLKIQLSPLVRPCFETEKARRKIAFSLRFEAEKPSAQNWSVGVFSRASLALRSETDSLTEPAKQRYRRFSFCHDTFPIQQNKTPLITQPQPGFSLPCLPNCANRQNRCFRFRYCIFSV